MGQSEASWALRDRGSFHMSLLLLEDIEYDTRRDRDYRVCPAQSLFVYTDLSEFLCDLLIGYLLTYQDSRQP